MGKNDYISNDLYKKMKNAANLELHTDISAPVEQNTVSKAQQRRLSDVYNAKLDLMARMERSLKKLSMYNEELEKIIAQRRDASKFLQENIDKLSSLVEPDGGRELHEYLREVEHLRMEYFRKEAEIEPLLENNNSKNKSPSFWDDLNEMKISHLLKLSFCGMFPLLITILISAVIVGAAVIFAMKI